jgi:flagellar biosynthesis/type III secretory pathway protein FliH
MQGLGNQGLGHTGLATSGYAGRIVRPVVTDVNAPAEGDKPPQPVTLDPREVEAEARLNEARKQADDILSKARAESKTIIDGAKAEAKHISDVRVGQEILAFNRRLRSELDTIRPMLSRMVIEAVEAIVGMLPDEEIAERMVRRALRDLDASTKAVLYASRADFVFMGQIVGKMQVSGDHSIHSVQVDGDLETGVCRVDAAGVSVEIGLKAQLELLESLLLREEAPAQAENEIGVAAAQSAPSGGHGSTSQASSSPAPEPEEAAPASSRMPVSGKPGVSSVSSMRRFTAEPKPVQKISAEMAVSDEKPTTGIDRMSINQTSKEQTE